MCSGNLDFVSLTSIFNAKGNEASVIYVLGFEQVGQYPNLIVQQRNMAFTAMTRTKGWCVLTGVGVWATNLFREFDAILTDAKKR